MPESRAMSRLDYCKEGPAYYGQGFNTRLGDDVLANKREGLRLGTPTCTWYCYLSAWLI